MILSIFASQSCRTITASDESSSNVLSKEENDPSFKNIYIPKYKGPVFHSVNAVLTKRFPEIEKRLSRPSKDVLVSRFDNVVSLLSTLRDAKRFAEKMAADICNKGAGGSNGEGDAIEHVALAAYTVKNSNQKFVAINFLNAREILPTSGAGELMDLYNNSLGFKLGFKAHELNMSKNEFETWIRSEINTLRKSGKFSVISEQPDSVCQNDNYPNNFHQSLDFYKLACSSVPGILKVNEKSCSN